jgi:photosystem II stability/assembly factor-like uncharacterized protein
MATAAAACVLAVVLWPEGETVREISTEPTSTTTPPTTTTARATVSELGPPPPHPDIVFVDAVHGWASGSGGIMATSDGGRTWRMQRPGQGKIGPVVFLDARSGWAVENGTLIATTDGGSTWTGRGQAHALDYASQLTFLDNDRGWAVIVEERCMQIVSNDACLDRGYLLRTIDGGLTWQRAFDAPANAMCWSGRRGWTISQAVVRTTTDAGRTWRSVDVPMRLEPMGSSIRCSGATAWMSGSYGIGMSQESYEVVRTLDGGTTWKTVLSHIMSEDRRDLPGIDSYSGPVAPPTPQVAIFVGTCPACGEGTISVTVTTDGGRTFAHHDVTSQNDPGDAPSAVSFPDPDHGWILGSSGAIYATSNGGVTWTRQFQSPLLVPNYG